MEAKKQAGRSPAACFAAWPFSDPAMRPTRSVTASAQALDHSLPGRPESSFPPLGLLFPTRTASLGSCGGPESGAYPAPVCRDGACPRPRAATRAAPTARVEDNWRGPMRAEGELPRRGKRGRPGVSAPTWDVFKGCNVGAGLVPARGRPRGPPLRRGWRMAAAGRCGPKANCPAGARVAALGCRPLRGMSSKAAM